jgi:hypothetical protein
MPVARRPAATLPRSTSARRSQRDSEALLVFVLTCAATLIAAYDLLLLALAAR